MLHLLPKIDYVIDGKTSTNTKRVVNILKTLTIKPNVLNDLSSFYEYYVANGERADQISYEIYGTVKYTYLIFLMNEIMNPFTDWPMSDQQLMLKMNSMYRSTDEAKQLTFAHYQIITPEIAKTIDADRIPEVLYEISEQTYNILPSNTRKLVSIYEHEVELNENKKTINLIKPSIVQAVDHKIRKELY